MEGYPEGWSDELKGGVQVLTRTFEFGNFAQAMAFAVHVGEAADAADHHREQIADAVLVAAHRVHLRAGPFHGGAGRVSDQAMQQKMPPQQHLWLQRTMT